MSELKKDIEKIQKDSGDRFSNAERDWRCGMAITLTGTALAVYVGGDWVLAFALFVAAMAIFTRPVLIKWHELKGAQWYFALGVAAVLGAVGFVMSIREVCDVDLGSGFMLSTLLLSLAFIAFVIALVFKERPPEQKGQASAEKLREAKELIGE